MRSTRVVFPPLVLFASKPRFTALQVPDVLRADILVA